MTPRHDAAGFDATPASPPGEAEWWRLPFREVALSGGTIHYRRVGSGTPLLFVHGVFVNGDLWRRVVPLLTDAFDCIVPDLPLGSHSLPMKPDAVLTPEGLARLLAELVETLRLAPVRIVANDSGGALTQILAANRPELVHSFVLTSGDAYEDFFPPLFRTLPVLARIPGGIAGLAQGLRFGWFQRLPLSYRWLTRTPLPADAMASYVGPMRRSAAIRRDLAKVLADVHPRHTLAAAQRLRSYPGRVLLVWGEHDRVFPLRLARRLAQDIPDATLVTVPEAAAFVPEDAPQRLAELVREFFGAEPEHGD